MSWAQSQVPQLSLLLSGTPATLGPAPSPAGDLSPLSSDAPPTPALSSRLLPPGPQPPGSRKAMSRPWASWGPWPGPAGPPFRFVTSSLQGTPNPWAWGCSILSPGSLSGLNLWAQTRGFLTPPLPCHTRALATDFLMQFNLENTVAVFSPWASRKGQPGSVIKSPSLLTGCPRSWR